MMTFRRLFHAALPTGRRLASRACWRLVGAVTLALATPALSAAASIAVADGAVAVASDGLCSLREAIHNANADAQVDNTDCLAGSGADTIDLEPGSTYSLPDADPVEAANGLPVISSTITIDGVGATIARGALACSLDGTRQSTEFRLLDVALGGDLTLNSLTPDLLTYPA